MVRLNDAIDRISLAFIV